MGNWIKGAIAGVTLAVLVMVAGRLDLIDVRWPWEGLPELAGVETDLGAPDGARVVDIEPITLDCRARIRAEVPVSGTREHRVLGQVYRTDRLTLDAVGDVDTCVEGTSLAVTHHRDGTTEIVVPAESIRLVRPRVDAIATADSVRVTKGAIGKLTDSLPWVDESSGLVPQGYAYAQHVIGGSACMEAAYDATAEILVEGYRAQFVEQGMDPDGLVVRIDGRPDFTQNEGVEVAGDFEFSAGPDAVACSLVPGSGAARPDPAP